ncbi:MAG: universal stress protein [Candidatus Dormibacteraeota bacterium]|jgi:nucleotide-binding universal stress UspA family protein|nr:universal stress protein [Candidatus Dormibacteraeota bacterium]
MSRIVVGVDGSQHSLAALRWACAEAKLRQASLELVAAWNIPAAALEAASAEVVDAMESSAAQALAAAHAVVAECGPSLEVTEGVYDGQPARILVERAKGAELLVVGSRGLGDFKALLLGSVSQECSHHSPVPIVIVRNAD